MAILSSKCHGIVAKGLLTPQSKNGSPFEEPFADFLLSHTLHLHAAFEHAQAHGDEEGHDEVVDRYDDERWEWLEADTLNGGRRIHQIGHTDDRDLRGLFDEGDEFIPDDGQDVADRLRDDDAHHRLPLREAKRHRAFELSLRDGLDARADDLTLIRTGIQDQCKDTGGKSFKVDAHDLKAGEMDAEERQPEKHERDLYQDRRTADDFYIGRRDPLEDLDARDLHECQNDPEKETKEAGQKRNNDGDLHT